MQRFFLTFAVCALTLLVSGIGLVQAQTPPKLKALIVDGQNNHNWRATTPVLKDILEKSERFTVDVATSPTKRDKEDDAEAYAKNMAAFKPDFAKYDVIIGNYNSNETRDDWSPETMKAFEQYIEDGGGFVCFHAADNSFPNWEAYNKMIGLGGWDRGHLPETAGKYLYWEDGKAVTSNERGARGRHGPSWAFLIEVRDKEHPIMAGLPEAFRHASDELYDSM